MLFISHGSSAQHRHFGHGVILKLLQRVPTWAKQLTHKIKLKQDGGIIYPQNSRTRNLVEG